MFKSFKNNFGKEKGENVVVDWLKIKECFGGEEENNSIQLIRKKRYIPPGYYKNSKGANMVGKVAIFVIGYIIVGGVLGVLLTVYIGRNIRDEIKCSVPVVHLSEIKKVFRRENQNSSPPPRQQPNRNPYSRESFDHYRELEMGYQPSSPRYQYHGDSYGRHRRAIENNQKGCLFENNGDSCPNNSFPISFHKDDENNSIYFLTKNGCFDNLKNENKIRKKRDIVEFVWVECKLFIMSVWSILLFIGWIVGAVFLGIYFWH
uniref:Uncharacterized protein n=1 Tax=Meloidogyne floridensis TaxID=298350 RepID=A0A915NGR9_9BILA